MESANPVSEYIAHVEPIQQVNLTAQVVGTIAEVHFKEGSQVEKGDLLFTIDPAVYEALVAHRKAELEQTKANIDRSEKYLSMLSAADNRSVSKSDRDSAETNVAEDRAMLHKAEASLQLAKIDLSYTHITSPIDGRIGRALITRGNLVSPSSGKLASVIQIDPIRVVFAMPDADYLSIFNGFSKTNRALPLTTIHLGNDMEYGEKGEMDFDDNQMNPATGTIDIRVRFPNPNRLLVPNNYVTVLLRDQQTEDKILVPTESIMHDNEGSFVWCVNEDKRVEQVRVEFGKVMGSRQVIESGLEPGRQVVFAGMQKLAPGMTVAPVETAKSK
jgi:RND family efflux transporter MFP subunit